MPWMTGSCTTRRFLDLNPAHFEAAGGHRACVAPHLPEGGSLKKNRSNVDLRGERPMHRTLVGDLEHLRALLLRQLAGHGNLPLDAIEQGSLGLALGAVLSMDPRMPEANRHACQRPALPSRIQRDRHRRSGAEG